MVTRSIRLLGIGIATGVAVDRLGIELRKPEAQRFRWVRRQVNENVNPWLLEHHVPGSATAEIGTLEHVGRTSGAVRLTPVHPTVSGDVVLIPAPMGVGSQWLQNVLHSGHARLQLHESILDLDRPELITVAETGFFAPAIAMPFDRLGWRYLRFHVAATAPGAFPTHPAANESAVGMEPIHDVSAEIPIEPRMVEREAAPA